MDYKAYLQQRQAVTAEAAREKLFKDAINRENEDRACFARARDGWEVLGREDLSSHPHPSLLPMFDAQTGKALISAYTIDPQGADDANLEKRAFAINPSEREKLTGTCAIVGSLEEFRTTFSDVFCEGQLRYLNWDNIFCAGGGVLACATPIPKKYTSTMSEKRRFFHDIQYGSSDVDLFLYGLNEEQARKKLVEIYQAVVDACPFEVVCFRSAHAVTLVSQYPFRHIQIVLRLYSSPYEVLAGFDVDACTVGFDGKMVYADFRAHHALVTRRNTIDFTRRSPSYEMRLGKYGVRGFEVEVPNLRRERVDPGIFERPWSALEGLAKLMVLERLRTPEQRAEHFERQKLSRAGHGGGTGYYSNRGLRIPGMKGYHIDSNTQQRIEEQLGGSAEVSNYSTVFLPWGPGVNVRSLIRLMDRKDHMLNNSWFSRGRDYRLHPCFFGTAEEILEDCSPDDPPFPEKPEEGEEEDPLLKEHRETYVRGRLTFLSDNPGRQRIGSFHPLDEHGWADTVYFADTTDTIFAAANVDDVAKLKASIDAMGPEPDLSLRDYFGRTVLHFSMMARSRNAIKYLLEAGANPMESMAGRRSCFHLAAMYDLSDMIPLLFQAGERQVLEKTLKELKQDKPDEKTQKKARAALVDWVRALESDYNLSAVQFALYLGNYACVDALVAIGGTLSSADLADAPKINPIALIAKDRAEEGVKTLLKHGFRSDQVSSSGYNSSETAIMFAVNNGMEEVFLALLKHDETAKKCINVLNGQGTYPLLVVAGQLNINLVKALLDAKSKHVLSPEDIDESKRLLGNPYYFRPSSSLTNVSHVANLALQTWMSRFNSLIHDLDAFRVTVKSNSKKKTKQLSSVSVEMIMRALDKGDQELFPALEPSVRTLQPNELDAKLEVLEILMNLPGMTLDQPKENGTKQNYVPRKDHHAPWTVLEDVAFVAGKARSLLNAVVNARPISKILQSKREILQAVTSELDEKLGPATYLRKMLLAWSEKGLAMLDKEIEIDAAAAQVAPPLEPHLEKVRVERKAELNKLLDRFIDIAGVKDHPLYLHNAGGDQSFTAKAQTLQQHSPVAVESSPTPTSQPIQPNPFVFQAQPGLFSSGTSTVSTPLSFPFTLNSPSTNPPTMTAVQGVSTDVPLLLQGQAPGTAVEPAGGFFPTFGSSGNSLFQFSPNPPTLAPLTPQQVQSDTLSPFAAAAASSPFQISAEPGALPSPFATDGTPIPPPVFPVLRQDNAEEWARGFTVSKAEIIENKSVLAALPSSFSSLSALPVTAPPAVQSDISALMLAIPTTGLAKPLHEPNPSFGTADYARPVQKKRGPTENIFGTSRITKSPYIFFIEEQMPKVSALGLTFAEKNKKLSQLWRDLSDADREQYMERARLSGLGTTTIDSSKIQLEKVVFPPAEGLFSAQAQDDLLCPSQVAIKQFLTSTAVPCPENITVPIASVPYFMEIAHVIWALPAMQRRLFALSGRGFHIANLSNVVLTRREQQFCCELFQAAFEGRTKDLWPLCEKGNVPIAACDADELNLLLMSVAQENTEMFQEVIRIAQMQYKPVEAAPKIKKKAAPRRIDNLALMAEMDEGDDYDEDDDEENSDYDDEEEEEDRPKSKKNVGSGDDDYDEEDDDDEGDVPKKKPAPKADVPGSNRKELEALFCDMGAVSLEGSPLYQELLGAIKTAEQKWEVTGVSVSPKAKVGLLSLAILMNSPKMVRFVLEQAARVSPRLGRKLVNQPIRGGNNAFELAIVLDRAEILQLLMELVPTALDFSYILMTLNSNAETPNNDDLFDLTPKPVVDAKSKKGKRMAVYSGYGGILTEVFGTKKNQLELEKANGSASQVTILPIGSRSTLMHFAARCGSPECYSWLSMGGPGTPVFSIISAALRTKEFGDFRARLARARDRCPLAFTNGFGSANHTVENDAAVAIRYLLGGDDTLVDLSYSTPLHAAIASRSLKRLLDNGVTFSPKLLSMSYESISFERRVLDQSNFRDGQIDYATGKIFPGGSPLNIACNSGYSEEVELLITKLGMSANFRDAYFCGMTPFGVAVQSNQFDTAKVVAKYSSPQMLILPDKLGITPLMICAERSTVDSLLSAAEMCPEVKKSTIVETLKARDLQGRTSLHLVAAGSLREVMRRLIEWSVEQEGKNWLREDFVSGRTAHDIAIDSSVAVATKRQPDKIDMVRVTTAAASIVPRIRAQFEDVRPARERRLEEVGAVLSVDGETMRIGVMQNNFRAAWADGYWYGQSGAIHRASIFEGDIERNIVDTAFRLNGVPLLNEY